MKYKYLVTFIILLLFPSNFEAQSRKYNPAAVEGLVKSLLSQMTLEEKVGQMTQITLQVISKTERAGDGHFPLDEEKLEEAIKKYNVGSILNIYDTAPEIDHWLKIITEIQQMAVNETRLGIPVIYGIDAVHGANYTKGATLFPQAINMAATRNKKLVEKIGEITAYETLASGIPWTFYPVMDIGRQPLWSRLWETFGEDVYLASQMGMSFIEGTQSDTGMTPDFITCLKHYVGYSFPINGRDRTPAWISERMLREYFLPPFEAGIIAGAQTVMVNSSEVDGIPVHSDYQLLTGILRGELNFKGFVVSDWEDIIRLHTRHRIAETPKEAVRIAVMAGVDMSMVPFDYSFCRYLIELVNEGSVPLWRINEAVGRILSVKMSSGLFENPFPDPALKKKIGSEEFTRINLEAARESIVLVKNDNNLLPLSKDINVLVTGPAANLLSVLNGGWSITWQGNDESLFPHEKNTVLEAIREKIGKQNVSYVEGTLFDSILNIEKAVNAAKQNDVIILCLGEEPYAEVPGSINDLTLDHAQLELAEKLAGTGKPIVLVLLGGRPRVINPVAASAGAVIAAFLPGMEGGTALADIIFGDYSPNGRLPVTYPRYPNGNTTYDYKPLEASDRHIINPQWSFGHGLSYSEFSYSNLQLDKNEIMQDDTLNISVDVTNSGKISAGEAVELYISDLYGSVSRPNKQLKGFEKIFLKPGETKTINFRINSSHLSFIGRENSRIVEPGEFEVMISSLRAKFLLR